MPLATNASRSELGAAHLHGRQCKWLGRNHPPEANPSPGKEARFAFYELLVVLTKSSNGKSRGGVALALPPFTTGPHFVIIFLWIVFGCSLHAGGGNQTAETTLPHPRNNGFEDLERLYLITQDQASIKYEGRKRIN